MSRLSVLLTGAAGRIGRHLWPAFEKTYALRTTDIKPLPERPNHLTGSLEDPAVCHQAVAGIDVVVHLAANPQPYAPFEKLLGPNIEATYQLFQAAAEAHVRRIVYASSCHVVLGHPPEKTIEAEDEIRPPTIYGVTKALGEAWGRYYHSKFGIEFVALRLGYFAPPGHGKGRREDLQHWIGPDDTLQLFQKAIEKPEVDLIVVNGASETFFQQLGLKGAQKELGFEPQQDARRCFSVPSEWQGPDPDAVKPPPLRTARTGPLKVLLTGAAGTVGRYLTERFRGEWDVRALDRQLDSSYPDDRRADLTDAAAMRSACEDRDVVIHLAANADDRGRWDQMIAPNIVGTYRLFQAACEAGVRRIVFASSSHTIFGYPASRVVEVTDPVQPANPYGVSKVYGELLGRYYHDQHGMEFVAVRIGGFAKEVRHPFLRSIWLSRDDAVRFFRCAVTAPNVGYTIAFATSRTDPLRVSLKAARERLGYEPLDDVHAADLP